MQRKYTERACDHCGALYYPRNSNIQFCSPACYHASRTARWEQRFWDTADRSGDCWLWQGNLGHFGYGKFSLLHKSFVAHRVAYKLAYGAIPEGAILRHTCDAPACIRPEHLIPGSQADNIRDRDARNRTVVGERHHAHKVTAEQVRAIRELRAAGKQPPTGGFGQ